MSRPNAARIWVDADACPSAIKAILYRAAERVGVEVILVANQHLNVPRSRFIRTMQVPGGFDVADRRIIDEVNPGDLVVTADIPLAAEVVAKDAVALNPRGQIYTDDNIREKLAMRDLMDELRASGEISGGPAALGKQDRQAFANELDRFLTRAL